MLGDVWRVNGNTWYSKKLIDKVIRLCKRTKEAYKDDCEKNLLADDILRILDYKDSKGEK